MNRSMKMGKKVMIIGLPGKKYLEQTTCCVSVMFDIVYILFHSQQRESF